MIRVKVRVEGLRELEKALKELPRATAANVMKRVLMQAGQPVQSEAAALAPVDTGTLQSRVDMGTRLTRRQKSKAPKESKVEVYIGVRGQLPRSHFQEFGTAEDPPQPYMRPAWDGNKMAVLESIKSLTWAEIEKAATRLARKNARAAAKAAAGS